MSCSEFSALSAASVRALLAAYGLELITLRAAGRIPASYWGAPEAGLAGRCVFVRPDTPSHSLLHETAHYVCMSTERRAHLWRDAGGDVEEEHAVCFLQVLLADYLPGLGRGRILADMDAWGYTFRQGSAAAWFVGDGRSAGAWLRTHGLIDGRARPTWRLRCGPSA